MGDSIKRAGGLPALSSSKIRLNSFYLRDQGRLQLLLCLQCSFHRRGGSLGLSVVFRGGQRVFSCQICDLFGQKRVQSIFSKIRRSDIMPTHPQPGRDDPRPNTSYNERGGDKRLTSTDPRYRSRSASSSNSINSCRSSNPDHVCTARCLIG